MIGSRRALFSHEESLSAIPRALDASRDVPASFYTGDHVWSVEIDFLGSISGFLAELETASVEIDRQDLASGLMAEPLLRKVLGRGALHPPIFFLRFIPVSIRIFCKLTLFFLVSGWMLQIHS